MSFLPFSYWWQDIPAFHEDAHRLLVEHAEKGVFRFLFYQKKENFVRLQVIGEQVLWERFLPWERWVCFLYQLEGIRARFTSLEDRQNEGFALFCDVFHVPLDRFSFHWVQVFSHGYIPFWFFPVHKEKSWWEFFLPVAEEKRVVSSKGNLVLFDEMISWQEEEKKRLFLSWGKTDVVNLDFFSSIVWQKTYACIHVIAHGKDGFLLSKGERLNSFPVRAGKMIFFHCCEMLAHSHSMVSHVLADGCSSVIAPVDTILDDGEVLSSIVLFYEIMQRTNPRHAFHLTGILSSEFKKTFSLAFPYTRLYG